MSRSIKFVIRSLLVLSLCTLTARADFREHFDLGQNYLSQYQYSGAIAEFKNALRINYLDTSARIGLINAYLARGAEYANKDRDWSKAANDYRSALFYLMYYPAKNSYNGSDYAIAQATKNLDKCLEAQKFNKSPSNRFKYAQQLRAEGNFAAAGYEFNQSLGDKKLQKGSFEQTADIFKILGNEPKSAEFYRKAVAVAPTDLALRLTYAKTLDKTEQEDDALKEYSYVLDKAGETDKEILYTLERTFKKKLSGEQNNANLNANMGAVLQKQGRLDEAIVYYRQAESLDPSNINTRINVGTLYQQKKDYKTAIKAYESVLILYPDNVMANLYRAQCYEKMGDTRIAQEGYRKVLALDPNNEYLKDLMLGAAKKGSTVQEFAAYVNTNFPQSNPSEIFYNYAIELHKNGKINDSLYMYDQAIKASKEPNAEMYVNMALAQAQKSDYDGAIATLNNAKSVFPGDASITSTLKNISDMKYDGQIEKAAALYNEKDYKNAIKTYLNIKPETADSMIGAASSYQELGDTDNAILYYQKALELKPLNSDIAYYIGVLYGDKGDYETSKIYLGKAIAFNKNNTDAIAYLKNIEEADLSETLNKAINEYEENNYDSSLAKLNKVLSKDKNNSYALYYRGMIYDSTDKKKEAIEDLKKAYNLNKDFEICNYIIASDYDTLEQYEEAYKYYNAYANSSAQEDEYKQYAKDRAEELKDYVGQKS